MKTSTTLLASEIIKRVRYTFFASFKEYALKQRSVSRFSRNPSALDHRVHRSVSRRESLQSIRIRDRF